MSETAGARPAASRGSLPPAVDELVSPYKAAEACRVASSTIHKWIDEERISGWPASEERQQRYPGAVLVSLSEVRAAKIARGRRRSARQAAAFLGVSETTVVYYCEQGYLPFERVGKLYEIDHRSLARFAELRDAGVPVAEIPTAEWHPRSLPKPEARRCELEGCDVEFVPTATQVENGYGRFHSRECEVEHRRRRAAAKPEPEPEPRPPGGRWVRCVECGGKFWRWQSALRFDREGGDFNFHDACYDQYRSTRGWPGAKAFLSPAASPNARRRVLGRWSSRKPPAAGGRPRGRPRTKITGAVEREIRQLAASGWGYKSIGRKVGVNWERVRDVLRGPSESPTLFRTPPL